MPVSPRAPPATAPHPPGLRLAVDRASGRSLTLQISEGLREAIHGGLLAPGTRLPSWRDLASQLGVARGTVRAAYEALIDADLLTALGAAGTHVARSAAPRPPPVFQASAARDPFGDYPRAHGIFQMGIPAQDAFPGKLWTRLFTSAVKASATEPHYNPDPRGEALLRREIAGYLAIARGYVCSPDQVFVTGGHRHAIALAVHALELQGTAWTEDPGYPLARQALALHGIASVPVPVDTEGIDVAAGMAAAPGAALAVVTPGQQAPLGVTLSPARRRALLGWARHAGAWILEDDYLGELQLQGRASAALAADAGGERVVHIGTFSKNISPTLRIGFVVAPAAQVARFDEACVLSGSAPAPAVQRAVADFLQGGHLLRHLRHMKRLYTARRHALVACLEDAGLTHRPGALAVLLRLPPGVRDTAFAAHARQHGFAPVPLSPWYAGPGPGRNGLALGITDLPEAQAAAELARLRALIDAFPHDPPSFSD